MVFEADTPAGKAFDIALIVAILASVVVVMVESIPHYRSAYPLQLRSLEWFFTIIFTIEYLLRLATVSRPSGYAFSFYGLVDFFAILPTYLGLIFPGTHYLLVIRLLRLLRVFRVLKLVTYLSEAQILWKALKSSRRKITVFLLAVSVSVVILGSLMYFIEGERHGYTSIPRSIYWAIVTLTTVGYGDISPQTPLGQAVASLVMILGYGIIAVPTGIVTAELTRMDKKVSTQSCGHCSLEGHDHDASYCKFCRTPLR